MAKSIPALVEPALLRWARESIGMDLATVALRLKLTETTIGSWEAGEARPTIAQLEKLANLCKRPLAAFYLPQPPEEFAVVRDFRTLPGAPGEPSTNLIVELRKAGARREIALELFDDLGEGLPTFSMRVDANEEPTIAASRIRQQLGVSPAKQLYWSDAYEALRSWRSAVEQQGVLVFQLTGVKVKETRGVSTFYDKLPVIAINSKDAATARCFTLIHELGHLLRRSGAVCDLDERHDDEIWCNAFAGELLVPTAELHAIAVGLDHHGEWDVDVLMSLARRFWVSPEVVLRRLVTIGRASAAFYREWRKTHSHEPAGPGGPVPVPRRILAHAGGTFVGLVLSAYHANRITASTLSNYLGVKLKHVPDIEALMVRGGAA